MAGHGLSHQPGCWWPIVPLKSSANSTAISGSAKHHRMSRGLCGAWLVVTSAHLAILASEKTGDILSNENTDHMTPAKDCDGRWLGRTIRQLTSVHALGELGPVAGLDPANRLYAAIAVRLEHRGFAFADFEPILAESIQDIRLMRDHDNIGAGRRHGRGHLAQRCCAPVVLDRRHYESALGVIGGGFHVAKAHQRAGVDRALEQAGVNLTNGNPELAQRFSDRFCQRAAIVVELTLLGDVIRIEGVGVGLILMGCAMAKNDHITTIAQGADPFGLRRGVLCRRGRQRAKCQAATEPSQSNYASYHQVLLAFVKRDPALFRVSNHTG